jgi:hypothetical protein
VCQCGNEDGQLFWVHVWKRKNRKRKEQWNALLMKNGLLKMGKSNNQQKKAHKFRK